MTNFNIYVDELPKKCNGCPLHNEDNGWCQVLICYTDDVPTDCPLKPLSDRLAEEKNKVVQEIKQRLCRVEDTLINLGNGKEDALNYFVKILDQIERGK